MKPGFQVCQMQTKPDRNFSTLHKRNGMENKIFKNRILLCLFILIFLFGSRVHSQSMEWEESEGEELRVLTEIEPEKNLSEKEIRELLDSDDCDPYRHIYVVSEDKCYSIDPQPMSGHQINEFAICKFSNDRMYNITWDVHENAPCYGWDGDQLLRGVVINFNNPD